MTIPGSDRQGNPELPSLSILSFQITDGERLCHYAFITALLVNDLFGIQFAAAAPAPAPMATIY